METTFVCNVDETNQLSDSDIQNSLEKIADTRCIRDRVIQSYDIARALWSYDMRERSVLNRHPTMLFYGCKHPSRRRRIKVNIDEMVSKWATVIPKLCTAHDKDSLDIAESRLDELLTPMLTAPVSQLREFFAKLVVALKADPSVPFMVWRIYESWHDKVIKTADDMGIKELKKDLATDIVELVDPSRPDIQADIRDSMINALMWRSPERLEEMKTAVVQGTRTGRRPRIKGRESCLFLQVEVGETVTEIML